MSTGRLKATSSWGGSRVYWLRLVVLTGFSVLSLWLGWRFALFVKAAQGAAPRLMEAAHQGRALESVELALPSRPPGVEAYLPISGLMGLFDWIFQGTLNRVHPAATVLVAIFLVTALLLRRGFCGWVCPVGLLSELAALPLRSWRRRDLRLPRWLDLPLRALKYLLLGFFLWSILALDPASIRAFIESPYNRIADVKMYLFFANPSRTALIVLAALLALSLLLRGLWCRYLCPYGALLGLASLLSPVAVRRDENRCIDCGRCERACWARLPVSKSAVVRSPECTGCLDCLASCPQERCLSVGTRKRRFSPATFALAIVLFIAGGVLLARLLGAWDNDIGDLESVLLILRAGQVVH